MFYISTVMFCYVNRWWKFLVDLVIVYNAFVIPFRCAFDQDVTSNAAYFLFDYIGDAILLVDIYVTLTSSFLENGYVQRACKL
jgi:hypothetical protein